MNNKCYCHCCGKEVKKWGCCSKACYDKIAEVQKFYLDKIDAEVIKTTHGKYIYFNLHNKSCEFTVGNEINLTHLLAIAEIFKTQNINLTSNHNGSDDDSYGIEHYHEICCKDCEFDMNF